jgi:hypothetical protein
MHDHAKAIRSDDPGHSQTDDTGNINDNDLKMEVDPMCVFLNGILLLSTVV